MKDNVFLDVNDGTTCRPLQVVLKKENQPKDLSYGCSITVEGEITQAPNGRAEMHAQNLVVVGNCNLDGYPFLPRKQYSQEYVRQNLHMRPRTKGFSSVLRLRDLADNLIRDHFRERNFINIHTPILTSNDCEGAGEAFYVQPNSKELLKTMKKEGVDDEKSMYFNSQAFLTVSGQLQLEVCARALSKVYNFCPAFRAENSKSRLHLSEFYMIEAEMAFMCSLKELATEAELLIKSVTANLFQKGSSDLENLGAPEPSWLEKDFVYVTYQEALNILNDNADKLDFPVKQGENLAKEHELFLVKHVGNVPVFVVEWPIDHKPFYMKQCEHDPNKVNFILIISIT